MRVWGIFIFIVGVLSSCLTDGTAPNTAGLQYVKDTTAIASYLAQHKINGTKLPEGIWFVVDSSGSGIRATFNDSVKLKYATRLLSDNSVVEQSSVPKHFVLDSLIRGVQIVMPEFQAGSKGRIFIPTSYSMGYRNLVALTNLIFEFQLIEVKDYQLKIDTAIIDGYLSSHSIKAFKDPSGLRYTIDSLVTGPRPLLTDQVQVNYTAKVLSDGSTIDQGKSVSLSTANLILGWQIGLQRIQQGSTCTLYIPSSLAYGASGNGGLIKANAILVFNITLIKVVHP